MRITAADSREERDVINYFRWRYSQACLPYRVFEWGWNGVYSSDYWPLAMKKDVAEPGRLFKSRKLPNHCIIVAPMSIGCMVLCLPDETQVKPSDWAVRCTIPRSQVGHMKFAGVLVPETFKPSKDFVLHVLGDSHLQNIGETYMPKKPFVRVRVNDGG